MAIVCRRGEVNGSQVGMIRIHAKSSTVDIRTDAAENFEEAVGARDKRNPHVNFRRLKDSTGARYDTDGPVGKTSSARAKKPRKSKIEERGEGKPNKKTKRDGGGKPKNKANRDGGPQRKRKPKKRQRASD
ncbi:MAG: hypothetical protein R3A47_10945 [Polyangiales bacterium]